MLKFTMNSSVLLGLCIATSGCMTPMEITQPPVSMNAQAGFSQEQVKGTTTLEVRSFAADATSDKKNARVEVGNASCLAKGPGFSAQFKTPAKLKVPVLKSRPDPMRIDCAVSDLKGFQTVEAGLPNATVQGGGLALGLASLIVTSAISSAIDEWRYAGNQGGVLVNLLKPEEYAAYVKEQEALAAQAKERRAINEAKKAKKKADQDG